MKIGKIFNEAFKKPERKYDYGCVMVGLDMENNEDKWNNIQKLIDEEDIYIGDKTDNGGFGRELDPHITILFGIHSDVPDEDVEKLIKDIKKPDVLLSGASSFKNKLFDVLKFDVKGDDLPMLNKKFTTLPHTTDYPNYHPHCTAAYIKSGKVDKYVEILNDYIKKNGFIEFKANEIVYSKPDGSKKKYSL